MDSDDERDWTARENDPEHKRLRYVWNHAAWPHLKLHEKDLSEKLRVDARTKGGIYYSDGVLSRRFFESIIGFHTGSLDLSGRHVARYTSLIARLVRLAVDLAEVKPHCVIREHTMTGPDGEPLILDGTTFTTKVLEVEPPAVEEKFLQKWPFLKSCSVGGLLRGLKETIDYMEAHPQPRIQHLILEQLPSELLHLIMGFLPEADARSFGATCRLLRAVSMSCIFETRSLLLEYKPDLSVSPEDEKKLWRAKFTASRNQLLSDTRFLLSHPDIQHKVRRLSIGNDWLRYGTHMIRAAGFDPSDARLFDPIFRGWCKSIVSCQDLSHLQISGVTLSTEMLRSIVSLPRLHTVLLFTTRLSNRASAAVMRGRAIPTSSSIINVIIIHPRRGWDLWYFVALCPKIRTLNILGDSENNLAKLPSEAFQFAFNPFVTLERFSISPVDNSNLMEVVNFAEWMHDAMHREAAPSPLPLTHLMFATSRRMTDTAQDAIIAALHGIKLRSLVLVGLETVNPALLARLSAAVPDLHALSLAYRANDYHDETHVCVWPHPTWEYAPQLAGFHSLRHFAWNSEMGFEPNELAPDIVQLEDGYPGDDDDDWLPTVYHEDEGCPDESVARLFSVYCPRLVSFGRVEDIHATSAWEISEGAEDGGKSYKLRGHWSNPDWCPSLLRAIWPDVKPEDENKSE